MKRIDAILGSTGFVGSNLARSFPDAEQFHRPNIGTIAGRRLNIVACAAAPGEKWLANSQPEEDRRNLEMLVRHIAKAKIHKVILISTVDVYPAPVDVDERSEITSNKTGYGGNRLWLEKELSLHFDCQIIRLPGLFGPGLKKNLVFDLLNDQKECIEKIDPDSIYQWFDIQRLPMIVQQLMKTDIRLLNLATEPMSAKETAEILGRRLHEQCPGRGLFHYDVQTVHGAHFGCRRRYLLSKGEIRADLECFSQNFDRTR